MLYDILPPLIFLFSLGGIIFLMARVSMRVRRADLQSNMTAAAATPVPTLTTPRSSLAGDPEMAALLRPSHKGVKVITSRMGGVLASLQSAGTSVREGVKQLPAKWQARRQDPLVEKIETVEETLTTKTSVVTPPAPAKPNRLVGRLRSVKDQLQERSQSQLQALKRVAQSRRQAPETVETEPVAVSEPKTPVTSVVTRTRRAVTAVATTSPLVTSFRAKGKVQRPAQPIGSTVLTEVQGLIAAADYQAAEELLLPHIVKHPKDTTAYLLLGEIALTREAWDEAKEIYEQVLRINPQTKGAQAGLGLAIYHTGDFAKALQMLQRALNEDATNRQVLEAVLSLAQKMDNPALQHSITEQLQELDRIEAESVEQPMTRRRVMAEKVRV